MNPIIPRAAITDLYYSVESTVYSHLDRFSLTNTQLDALFIAIRRTLEAHLSAKDEQIEQDTLNMRKIVPPYNEHHIKIRSVEFDEIKTGRKRFILRQSVKEVWEGDTLNLIETEHGDFMVLTGQSITNLVVTFVSPRGFNGLKPGYVALGFNTTETTLGADW